MARSADRSATRRVCLDRACLAYWRRLRSDSYHHSSKNYAIFWGPGQIVGLALGEGRRRAIAEMMLDFQDFAVVRFEEVHDRRAEVFAGDIVDSDCRHRRDRPRELGDQPVVTYGIGRLRTRHANAEGESPVGARKNLAVESAVKHIVAVQKTRDIWSGRTIVHFVGLAKLPDAALVQNDHAIAHRQRFRFASRHVQ